MRRLSSRLEAAEAAIDAVNAADPTRVRVDGDDQPLALVHGRLAAAWVARLVPDPPDTLLLAARAHHLARWQVPRSDYPDGRAGYLRWRRDAKQRHARDVAELLVRAGYGAEEVEAVQALIRRDGLAAGDPGAQAVEDAAALVFLQTQLSALAARLEHDRLLEVLRKTASKLSPAGQAAVADVPLTAGERALVAQALG